MIELRKVDSHNYWEVISLSVKEQQKKFVTSNAISLGQAYVQPECKPLAIYAGKQLVGFVMYCIDTEDHEHWIYRLMIDQHFQGRGYAKEALKQLIDQIKQDQQHHKIYLGVHKEGNIAVQLYESLGFRFNGQTLDEEHLMVLEY